MAAIIAHLETPDTHSAPIKCCSTKSEEEPKMPAREATSLPPRAKDGPTETPERDRYLQFAGKLSETTVSVIVEVPLAELRAQTRCRAQVAFARQVAMYVAHVNFGLTFSETGTYFGRDRTTVSHACRLVEDQRDNDKVEKLLCQIEEIMNVAQEAFLAGMPVVPINLEHQKR